jgi:hypothetical protein
MALCWSQQKRCRLEGPLPAVYTIKSWDSSAVPGRETANIGLADVVGHGQRTKASPRKRPRLTMNTAPGDLQTTTSTPFRFFELPQEIRDQVFSSLVVRQHPHLPSVLDAAVISKNRKKRQAALKARHRLNQQRLSAGLRPTCARTIPEPLLHLDLLRTSKRMYEEATDCLYTNNWFAISLAKLPCTVFEIPDGWNLSRVKRLQLDVQLKDAIRMDRHIDWTSFFSAFPSVRFLRIIPTLHSRYYEWAHSELCDWQTTHYVHKAFFRELLGAIPDHIEVKIGALTHSVGAMELQGKLTVGTGLLWDMYTELGRRTDSTGRLLAVNHVVDCGQARY